MATFLELCSDLARESGAVGPAPAAVTGQTGRQLKAVEWIKHAWILIQNSKANWSFMRGEWSGPVVLNVMTYSSVDFSITRFGEWIGDYGTYRPVTLYDPAIGKADEGAISQISWERWKLSYDRGTHTANRPHEYCLAPDGTIRFGVKPNKTYTARGEYRKTAQVLAANLDVPDMPSRFHSIIVWRAIMLMADSDEAVEALTLARAKHTEMYGQMCRDLLPSFNVRGERPLA